MTDDQTDDCFGEHFRFLTILPVYFTVEFKCEVHNHWHTVVISQEHGKTREVFTRLTHGRGEKAWPILVYPGMNN